MASDTVSRWLIMVNYMYMYGCSSFETFMSFYILRNHTFLSLTFFLSDPRLVAFLTLRQRKNKDERTHRDTSMDRSNGGEFHGHITSCAMDIESNHDGKHVHFSENVEIIKPDNKEETMSDHSTADGCITIGDMEVSSKWLHMGTVETKKLEWMKDCQTPSAVESKVYTFIFLSS